MILPKKKTVPTLFDIPGFFVTFNQTLTGRNTFLTHFFQLDVEINLENSP